MKLLIVFSRFGPYHVARLDAVGKQLPLTAVELSGKATEYAWDPVDAPKTFRRVTVFPDQSHRDVSRLELRRAVNDALNGVKPDVVALPGWSDPGALAALQWCRKHNVPRVVMSASSARDAPRQWWRESIKSQVVNAYDAGLVGGTPHADYLRSLGMPDSQVFTGYNVVDNAHFEERATSARRKDQKLRQDLELPSHYFLAVGRFVPKKNFNLLLKAFARYHVQEDNPFDLVILGDGPLGGMLRETRSTLNLENCVHFPGFKQYDMLPVYYGLAEAFVHTSTREQWGLVVNEAMASRLPVIVSNRCGCVPDLVQEPENGASFDPEDSGELAEHLAWMSAQSTDREAMGASSQRMISSWTPDSFARQMLRAAEAAQQHRNESSYSLISGLVIRGLIRR